MNDFKVGDFVKLALVAKDVMPLNYSLYQFSIGKITHIQYHVIQQCNYISVCWSNDTRTYVYMDKHLVKTNLKAFV